MWCSAHENRIISYCDKCNNPVCIQCCEHEKKIQDTTLLLKKLQDKKFDIFLSKFSTENEKEISQVEEKIKLLLNQKEKLIKKAKTIQQLTQEISNISEDTKFEDLIYLEKSVDVICHKKLATINFDFKPSSQIEKEKSLLELNKVLKHTMKPISKILHLKVLILGLEDAGKTVLLYKWKLDDIITTIPTIGFNIETILYKNLCVNFWDVGGNDRIRPFWTSYYVGCHFICFVVDTSDLERKQESIEVFKDVINDNESKNANLILICNKKDIQRIQISEIINDFGLEILDRKYFIFETSYNEKEQDKLFEWMQENIPYIPQID
eukprot:gene4009-7265_t